MQIWQNEQLNTDSGSMDIHCTILSNYCMLDIFHNKMLGEINHLTIMIYLNYLNLLKLLKFFLLLRNFNWKIQGNVQRMRGLNFFLNFFFNFILFLNFT